MWARVPLALMESVAERDVTSLEHQGVIRFCKFDCFSTLYYFFVAVSGVTLSCTLHKDNSSSKEEEEEE